MDIFQIFSKCFDLDQSQGHQMSHNFEGLSTGYLLAKNHNSTVNDVWDIVKNCQKGDIFQISSKYCNLDKKVKVIKCHIILKVSS